MKIWPGDAHSRNCQARSHAAAATSMNMLTTLCHKVEEQDTPGALVPSNAIRRFCNQAGPIPIGVFSGRSAPFGLGCRSTPAVTHNPCGLFCGVELSRNCRITCFRRLRRRESRRSLRSRLVPAPGPEQGASPDGSSVKPAACRPLRR